MKYCLLAFLLAVGLFSVQAQKDSLTHRQGGVAQARDYDNSWLTTILVIAIPLILIPYILFLFTSIPYGGGHHGGYGGHGGYGHGGGHNQGWGGYGRSSQGSKANVDDTITKRVLSSI